MRIANVQIPATIQTATVGRSNDPHLSTTLGNVESRRCSAQVQKDFLRNIFGFRVIAHNSERDTENQPSVAIEKDG
jgi:hypothetical protein